MGIDPGSRAMGYGVVQREGSKLRRIGSGVIRPRGGSMPERLAELYEKLSAVIAEHSPETAALESVFLARNPRSALLLGQARGVALAACGAAGLDTAEYAPTEVKMAVAGYGRAEKSQVQGMIVRLLALDRVPGSDEADALAVAICHGARRGTARAAARALEQGRLER